MVITDRNVILRLQYYLCVERASFFVLSCFGNMKCLYTLCAHDFKGYFQRAILARQVFPSPTSSPFINPLLPSCFILADSTVQRLRAGFTHVQVDLLSKVVQVESCWRILGLDARAIPWFHVVPNAIVADLDIFLCHGQVRSSSRALQACPAIISR